MATFPTTPVGAGRVGFLINPRRVTTITRVNESRWSNRKAAIKVHDYVWVNVYAPKKRDEQRRYFRGLGEFVESFEHELALGGVFHCAQQAGGPASSQSELHNTLQ